MCRPVPGRPKNSFTCVAVDGREDGDVRRIDDHGVEVDGRVGERGEEGALRLFDRLAAAERRVHRTFGDAVRRVTGGERDRIAPRERVLQPIDNCLQFGASEGLRHRILPVRRGSILRGGDGSNCGRDWRRGRVAGGDGCRRVAAGVQRRRAAPRWHRDSLRDLRQEALGDELAGAEARPDGPGRSPRRAVRLVGAGAAASQRGRPGSAGRPRRRVDVTQPDWVDVHCVRQVGLRTDVSVRQTRPAADRCNRIRRTDSSCRRRSQSSRLKCSPASDREVQARRRRCPRRVQQGRARGREPLWPLRSSGALAKGSRRRSKRSTPTATSRACTTSRRHVRIESWGSAGRVRGDGVRRPAGSSRDARRFARSRPCVDLLRCDRYGASYMLPLRRDAAQRQAVLARAVFRMGSRAVRGRRDRSAKTVDARINVYGGGC